LPQATGLVAELKAKYGDDTACALEAGRGGVFDVKVDGELVYSKHAQGNAFPRLGEIPEAIDRKLLQG